MIKPRLFTDRTVFETRDGQGFLIEGDRVVAARADAASVEAVEGLLGAAVGNPLA